MDDVMTTMTDLYVAGDIGMTMPMLKSLDPKKAAAENEQGYAAFEQRIITDRNHVMAERAAPSLPRAMSSWPSARCICPARKALSNFCEPRVSRSRGLTDPLTPDADGPDIGAERPHRRRHDAAVKRPDDKKIEPPKQVLAPDDGGDSHHLAVPLSSRSTTIRKSRWRSSKPSTVRSWVEEERENRPPTCQPPVRPFLNRKAIRHGFEAP